MLNARTKRLLQELPDDEAATSALLAKSFACIFVLILIFSAAAFDPDTEPSLSRHEVAARSQADR